MKEYSKLGDLSIGDWFWNNSKANMVLEHRETMTHGEYVIITIEFDEYGKFIDKRILSKDMNVYFAGDSCWEAYSLYNR